MAHLYDESDSMDSSDNNQDSYNQVFGHDKKKNIAIGTKKNFAATDKYNISKVKNNMLNNFGNSMGGEGFGNFGNTGQLGIGNMVGPFSNTGGFGKGIKGDLFSIGFNGLIVGLEVNFEVASDHLLTGLLVCRSFSNLNSLSFILSRSIILSYSISFILSISCFFSFSFSFSLLLYWAKSKRL